MVIHPDHSGGFDLVQILVAIKSTAGSFSSKGRGFVHCEVEKMAKNKKRKKSPAKAPAASGATQASQVSAPKTGGKSSVALPSMSRRNALRAAAAAVVVVGGGVALHRHDVQAREMHDLASIGQGVPTVVQVHDTTCPSCRALMSATRKAIEDFPGVNYRVADITTADGREFQAKYNAQKITLILLDSKGKRLQTLTGVRTPEELRELFAATFGPMTDAEVVSS
ncbi:thioredoxin family protein [bacterium]|nr:thioredoxin family protein [bacterium]